MAPALEQQAKGLCPLTEVAVLNCFELGEGGVPESIRTGKLLNPGVEPGNHPSVQILAVKGVR
jgi:hypothetical protein